MRARALAPLLFLSGAAALILEVCWFRRMAQVAGGTAVAMSAVLAAVIGGMALGAWLVGRRADGLARPARLYGALELGVAVFALATPALINASRDVLAASVAVRFLLAVLLLAPPAVLMGGTLPAVVAALRERDGRSIGWLYAANTLGAVAGTVAAGFFLIPRFGLAGSMRWAAVFSGTAGTIAWLLPAAAAARSPDEAAAGSRRAILLYAVSGFLGLTCEVAFVRQLVLVFGSTTYAFSTMLAVFLLGIGIGGAVGTRARRRHLARLEWTVAATGGLFALSALSIYALPRLYLEGLVRLGDSFEAGLALRFVLAAVALLPGSIGLGIAFPLAAHAAGRTADSTGRLYAWNTVASVLGSTLAVFLFVPLLGPHLTIVCAAVVAVLASRRWLVLAVVAIGFVPPPAVAREHLHAGVFFIPGAFLLEGEINERVWDDGVDIPFTAHGREATVSIWRWYGKDSILIDGKAVATNQVLADVHHLSLLGHVPMAVHPDPRRVLVVGLGLGTTFRAVREHHPAVLRVVEIEGAVAEAAARLGTKPDDLVIEDARSYLKRTDETFDVITSDPIHPWVRGGGDLYTIEYFELVKKRLSKGGVACQWLPVYQMGMDDIRDVIRTFTEVFTSDAYYGGGDLVLVGGAEALPVARSVRSYTLRRIGAENLGELLVARHDKLRAQGGRLLTDDALRLEFSTPRYLTNPVLGDAFVWLQGIWADAPLPYKLVLEAQIAWWDGRTEAWENAMRRARGVAGQHGFVRTLSGEDDLLWASTLLQQGKLDKAAKWLDRAASFLPGDPRVKGTRAELLEARGDKEGARKLFQELLETMPDSEFLRRKVEKLTAE